MHEYHWLYIHAFLNVNKLTPEQLEWLKHKLPNYMMVNNDSLEEKIQ